MCFFMKHWKYKGMVASWRRPLKNSGVFRECPFFQMGKCQRALFLPCTASVWRMLPDYAVSIGLVQILSTLSVKKLSELPFSFTIIPILVPSISSPKCILIPPAVGVFFHLLCYLILKASNVKLFNKITTTTIIINNYNFIIREFGMCVMNWMSFSWLW